MDEQIRYDILKTELKLTQAQMDKYDKMSATTKTWAVTLWVAAIGWAFQVHHPEFFLISIVPIPVFWALDGLNKTFRQGYKKRRVEVSKILEHLFRTGKLPDGAVAPRLPQHNWDETANNMFLLHVAAPYVLLIVISIVLYARF